MAYQLCHALFTQLELGLQGTHIMGRSPKILYRPGLLANPCGTWTSMCISLLGNPTTSSEQSSLQRQKLHMTLYPRSLSGQAWHTGTKCQHMSSSRVHRIAQVLLSLYQCLLFPGLIAICCFDIWEQQIPKGSCTEAGGRLCYMAT